MAIPAKHYPVIIAYSRPFRLIFRDKDDTWDPTLEEVNLGTYDYVKLHRISSSFKIALPTHPFLYLGFNGALILPALPEFIPIEKAVLKFNAFLGELILGGIFYEAIYPSDLVQGVIYDTGYYRSVESPHGANAEVQISLQAKIASPIHAINLYKPMVITAAEIQEAKKKGSLMLAQIPNLSPELLLRGVSSFVNRAWAEALSNLWIGIEQIVSFLWVKEVVKNESLLTSSIQGRKEFLLDTRTWTSSTRIELLFQKQLVHAKTYALISAARKARNTLAHEGTLPDRTASEAAFDAIFQLLSGVCCSSIHALDDLAMRYKNMDPITLKRENALKEPMPLEELSEQSDDMWLGPFPPIPGEIEWEGRDTKE